VTTTTLPAPAAVWDTRDRDSFFWDTERPEFWQAIEWARNHIPRPEATYRVEFYLVDCPFAIVYRFVTDDRGRVMVDEWELCGCATEEPARVMLTELPPEHLQGTPV
jgi:hypothetical protein